MSENPLNNPEELNPSTLGTKEYWQDAYEQELQNFNDHGDVGEIWFGEDCVDRLVTWLSTNENIHQTDPVLDLGSGNGVLLIELAKRGFKNVCGVDFIQSAVELAQSLSMQEGVQVKFEVEDILKAEECLSTESLLKHKYKVVLDKGTYDAISLSPENPARKRQCYIDTVDRILDENGFFALTSCNWTREDLIKHFNKEFILCSQIPAPIFHFGGKTGNTVTSLVFKKKKL
ncbi:EEF1A lysine methyltransferase 2-like [Limulus polyphemus]|uniref:Protein-lysine N-methyltransferase LOC106463987 n=1 Tax=Limulus polyphemus TaxID=6850 RepID=A0ABM1SUP1_LIMPO|nr:EEF1A lysine methyltransferase 2-like [Limulus polyphemus]XP_022247347.1 EEF1A lysine methyltransferase 2-like [Limulus polyphemus]